MGLQAHSLDLVPMDPVMFGELQGMHILSLVYAEGTIGHSHLALAGLNINPGGHLQFIVWHLRHLPLEDTKNPGGQEHALFWNTYVGRH